MSYKWAPIQVRATPPQNFGTKRRILSGNQTQCLSYRDKENKAQKVYFRAEARRTTILQPVEQKPHSQKDRQDEKAEGYAPDEGTR